MVLNSVVLMYFAMPPQVGDHGEVATTTLNFAGKRCHVLAEIRFFVSFFSSSIFILDVKDGEK